MGTKPFSLSLGSKSKTSKSSVYPTAKPLQKPALISHDSDAESDNEGAAEEVSHFDVAAGGAVNQNRKREEKGPLIIKSQSNRNWREETRRKRQKAALPGQQEEDGKNRDLDLMEQEEKERLKKTQLGLNIMRREDEEAVHTEVAEAVANNVEAAEEQNVMTDDARALAALKGEKVKSDLVIGAPAMETEEEAFEEDYRKAPDAPTQADYARIPVDDFGAALLRGMGWKEGQDLRGKPAGKSEEVRRRPALLGIGAKSEAATGVELGTWDQGNKGKRNKRAIDQEFTPVILQNKVTGERLTEEQLKEKLQKEKEQTQIVLPEREKDRSRHASDRDYESSARKHRRHYDDDYDSRDSKRSRREGGRDYGHDTKRHRLSHRDKSRSLSPDGRHGGHKKRDRDDADRKHRYSRRERSYTPEEEHRTSKKAGDRRDRDRKHDNDGYKFSKRDRSRSRERKREYDDERRQRRELEAKNHRRRDRDDRY